MKSPICHPGRNLAWGLATSLPQFWAVPRQPPSPTVRKPFCSFLSPFSILLLSSRQGATLVISHIKVLPIFYGKCDIAPRTFRSHSFGQFSQDVNSRPPGTQSPSCRQIPVVNTPFKWGNGRRSCSPRSWPRVHEDNEPPAPAIHFI